MRPPAPTDGLLDPSAALVECVAGQADDVESLQAWAGDTVSTGFADARADLLPVRATSSGQEIEATIRDREPQVVDRVGWLRIDDAERRAGRAEQRPRVRQTDVRRLVKLAAE